MGRIYSVPYTGTVSNAGGNADLLECLPASAKPVYLRGMILCQISEVGDSAEEGLSLEVLRMTATVTSGNGTSVTPVPRHSLASTAASFTAECNGATVATTSGTTTILDDLGWNIRNSPFDFWYPDKDFAPGAVNAEGLFVRMLTTPADDFTGCFTFFVQED